MRGHSGFTMVEVLVAAALVHPPVVALPDCILEAVDTSQLPHAVELSATCTRGGHQHQATRWATWMAPAPTTPPPGAP